MYPSWFLAFFKLPNLCLVDVWFIYKYDDICMIFKCLMIPLGLIWFFFINITFLCFLFAKNFHNFVFLDFYNLNDYIMIVFSLWFHRTLVLIFFYVFLIYLHYYIIFLIMTEKDIIYIVNYMSLSSLWELFD